MKYRPGKTKGPCFKRGEAIEKGDWKRHIFGMGKTLSAREEVFLMGNGTQQVPRRPVTWVSYIALALAIVIFSGIFASAVGWWKIFDFTVLLGSFGSIKGPEASFIFRGAGGTGARDGFLFSISLMPAVILALGIVSIVESLGGLAAAEKMMNPLLNL